MSERTWSIRLSVDDLNASIYLLESDSEVAAWTRGLMRGLNNGDAKDSASHAYSCGWEIGKSAREKADKIRAGLAENGSAGGKAKASNCQANAKAIATADATPIAEAFALAEPRTKNQEQETKERRTKFIPPTLDELTAYAKEIGFRDPLKWMNHYTANGWMVGKNKMKDWKACVRNWNLNPIQGSQFGKPGQQPLQFGKEYHESQRIVNADGTF